MPCSTRKPGICGNPPASVPRVLGMQSKQMMLPFVLFAVALVFSPGCPRTPSIDQIGLEFRNLPTSASLMPGLKLCTTNPGTNDVHKLNFPLITKFLFQLGCLPSDGIIATSHHALSCQAKQQQNTHNKYRRLL